MDKKLEFLLETLGCEKITVRGDGWINCTCPLHEDKHKSFGISYEQLNWKCFAGCGNGFITKLIQKYYSVSFTESIKILETFDIYIDLFVKQKNKLDLNDFVLEEDGFNRKFIDEYIDNNAFKLPIPKYWFERGFDEDDWMEWEVYYNDKKEQIVFDCITAVFNRSIKNNYKNYLQGSDKTSTLYGINHCNNKKAVILTEGTFDVIKAKKYLGHSYDVVATLGLVRSLNKQIKWIIKQWDIVVLGYDKDEAGISAMIDLSNVLEKENIPVYYIKLKRHKDLGEIESEDDVIISRYL